MMPELAVSRLDSAIRRLEAQRACLDHAVALIADLDGIVLELGLGNGRTFDHLRERLPGRPIYVVERQVAAHPDCIPASDCLILGDVRDELAAACPRFAASVALAHVDLASGDEPSSDRLFAALPPLLAPLMRAGGIVVSERQLSHPCWRPLGLPPRVPFGRYWIYRAVTAGGQV
jgi:hypothetical protein